jgi:predicted AlkP superfamily phosphohydrolase/phosphomutase
MASERTRVLALGIDAAEPRLVRELLGQGELPCLGKLLARGSWSDVQSPADIGSSAVWPAFVTGTEAAEHGTASVWGWDPSTMTCTDAYAAASRIPFWKSLVDGGLNVGVLDVPFAPVLGMPRGFEISEWGPHDTDRGTTEAFPDSARLVLAETGAHPFVRQNLERARPRNVQELMRLSSAALDGIQLRGRLAERLISERRSELAIVVFTEIHHTAHSFWHTIEPDHPLYARDSFQQQEAPVPTLLDLLREVDRQIGRLVQLVGDDAGILVFSLHGMGPGRGIPTVLEPLLDHLGFSRLSSWSNRSWTDRARSLLSELKRRAPAPVKELYRQRASTGLSRKLAQPTMIASYDWASTRALALPTDQHGYVRLNVMGREALGIVRPEDYERTLDELEGSLRAARTTAGAPLVRDLVRLGAAPEDVHPQLADLVVHWDHGAFDRPVRVAGSSIESHPVRLDFTGQHEFSGFCIAAGGMEQADPGANVRATGLGERLVAATLGEGVPAA